MPESPVVPESPKTTAVLGGDFSAFQREQRAEERGDRTPTKEADSSPAKPVEDQAASTDAIPPAASEPAKPRNADTRIQELLADRAAERQRAERAERELTDLRAKSQPDVKPAASSPAAGTDPEPDPNDLTKYPEGQFDRKYLKDQARWEAREEYRSQDTARTQREQQTQTERALVDTATKFHARMLEHTKAVPDFATRVTDEVKGILPTHFAQQQGLPITALNALGDEFLEAEDGPRLMQHFSETPGELQRFGRLPPKAFFGELALLRASFKAAADAPPPPKHVTDAPPPPPTLGSRPAEPVDQRRAAVESGDFPRFQAAQRRLERRT